MKLYKISKGRNGGANKNTVSIEITGKSMESAIFLSKCKKKAESLFGLGLSLDQVGTVYGIHFRSTDKDKNLKAAKTLIKIVELEAANMLIKAVELEQELLKFKI